MTVRQDDSHTQSTHTMLLYCPYDRRVTRHVRSGRENSILCAECGRPTDPTDRVRPGGQEALPSSRVTTAPTGPTPGRSTPTPRRRHSRRSPFPFALALLAAFVAILASLNIVGGLLAPPHPELNVAGPDQLGPGQMALSDSAPAAAVAVADLRIANTGGIGAFIRRTPSLEDRLRAWPDGAPLKTVGPDLAAGGIEWKRVQDPAGNRGWIPAQYTSPATGE